MRRVLALDPSFTAWGWAVVEVSPHIGGSGKLVSCGTIRTSKSEKGRGLRKSDDDLRRAQELYRELSRVWLEFQPVGIVTEIPGGSKSARASKTLGIAAGVLASFAEQVEADVEFYTPQEIKKAVTGNRNANKDDIEMPVRLTFGGDGQIPEKPRVCREAVVDALAVYIAAQTGNLCRRLRRLNEQEAMA